MGTHPIFESDFDCLTDKMSTEAKIPEADLKNVNLKPTETVEKVILPSAEDVNRERVPLDAASFQKENLKKVTPIVNDQVQRESSILKAANFDHQNLKKVETEEKTRLPSTEDIARERVPLDAANFQKENLKSVATIESPNRDINLMKVQSFDQSKLKKVEAVEKIVLPTDDEIKREKTMVNITTFDKEQLKPTETVEKVTLPTADDIKNEAEQ